MCYIIFLFCSFSKYIIFFFRPLFCKMPSQQNTPLLYSLWCILVYNALPCIYIHRGYVLCCILIQWFVNVIITLILPPMHSHRYIYIVDGYMDIYYCTLYKACIMITWQFHLSINWKNFQLGFFFMCAHCWLEGFKYLMLLFRW